MAHELKTGGDRGYLRIATEEAFGTREIIDTYLAMIADGSADKGMKSLWGFYATSPSERAVQIMERLVDLDEMRIKNMDATGVDVAIIALTAPGVQPIKDVELAKRLCTNANDALAAAVARYPDRYIGLAAVAPQDPEWSAQELKRCAAMGFKGVQINSHTQGEYLDDPKYAPIFETLVELGWPLYIHPSPPPDEMMGTMVDAGLDGAVFGFGVETGFHLLRLITDGIFDRYPSLQIIVGHMGEALPYWMYRLNYMHQAGVRSGRYEKLKPLKHDIFYYMQNNVYVTTSGMAWAPAIKFAQQVLGEDRVMYAMDYPYQYVPDEVRTHDNLDVSDLTKKKLMQLNAEKAFNLKG